MCYSSVHLTSCSGSISGYSNKSFTFSDVTHIWNSLPTVSFCSCLVQFSFWPLFAFNWSMAFPIFFSCNFKKPLSYNCFIEVLFLNCLHESFICFLLKCFVCWQLTVLLPFDFISSFSVSNKFSLLRSSFSTSCCLSFFASLSLCFSSSSMA